MSQELENKIEFKDKLLNYYNLHKLKIFASIIILILVIIFGIFNKINNEKKNIIIAEKFVKAGIHLSSNEKDRAKILYEEIVLSENKFYSLLALLTIVEKNLIKDDKIILDYFTLLEKLNYSKEKLDLISLKKALYLIKVKKNLEGNKLLKNLIEKKSKFKLLAEEIISN